MNADTITASVTALATPAGADALEPDAVLKAAWLRRGEACDGLDLIGGDPASTGLRSLCAVLDKADTAIQAATAKTLEGVAIQLWLALAHTADGIEHDEAIKARDLKALEATDALDFNADCIVAALRSLASL